ncbi:MAG: hypothetical protein H7Y11_00510 [Armatimonadetes bacterium]|nr:hypothetical protein [Anaerolineae bacterium]
MTTAAAQAAAQTLLLHALETRDAEAAQHIAQMMDAEPALDAALDPLLQSALETQPDALYFLVRTHLYQLTGGNPDPRMTGDLRVVSETQPLDAQVMAAWLPRLQAAAVASLRVAVDDSDTETLISWLKLIVREPSVFELGDVLRQGITAAQARTHQDGGLGYQLLLFAAKKAPNALDMLLADQALLSALPEPFRAALALYNPAAIDELYTQARGIYLVALRQTIQYATPAQAALVFTPQTLLQLWSLYADEQHPLPLPSQLQPGALFDLLLTHGLPWLSLDALVQLLTLTLAHQADPYLSPHINVLIQHVALHDPAVLTAALVVGGFPMDGIIMLLGAALAAGALTPQQTANTYLNILDAKHWARPMVSVAEQVSRLAYQSPGVLLPPERMTKLMQFAAEYRADQVARCVAKRVLHDLERVDNERELGEQFLRLSEQVQWCSGVRHYTQTWWRDFVRAQPQARLQQLDKVLDGKRADELRAVVQTTLALRRVFGKRSLAEFSESVNDAYALLSVLAESFDPLPKHPFQLDQTAVRLELEAHDDELSPDARRVLAKNLKELGNLIVEMSEYRTRASLIRREDDVERGLMSGEHQPHSAIDMLKWLSGYLDGAQDDDEAEA